MTTDITPETKGASDLGFAIDDLMRAFEAFKDTNDRRLDEIERRQSADTLTTDKLARIDRALDDNKRVVDELALKSARPPLGGPAPRSAAALQHKTAFEAYVRQGSAHGLRDLEGKALSVGSDPDGGYLVPDELERSVNSAVRNISPIRAIAGVRQVSGSVYKKPFAITGAETGWVAETAARPETDAPTLAELSFPTMELYAMPAATSALLDDSAVNIDEWIAEEVRSAFAEQEGTAFVTGNGTARPKGFLDYTKVAQGSWSWGNIGFILTGADGAFATTNPGDKLIALTRAQETDLPASARIGYSACESDYRQAVAEARRLVGASGRVALAELPVVMEADQAVQIAESWLFEAWAARDRAGFALPPSRLAVEPGDVLSVEVAGRVRLLRVSGIGDHGAREIEALGLDPDVYTGIEAGARPQSPPPDIAAGQPLGIFLDLPLLTGAEQAHIGYVAAAQTPWPGAVAFHRSPESAGFTLRALATVAATTGITLDDLAAGPEGRLDRAARVRVRLDRGELNSVTRAALLAGSNAAALQNADGGWEVLQFESAMLVAPATYELSTLLRAQAGTDGAMLASLAAGARFMLLDRALTPVDMAPADIGLAFNWRFGPASRDIGHASYAGAVHTFTGAGLRPLSPVHVRGQRDGSGDLAVTWVRRTRINGDAWAAGDVPLSEESELYEIDILDEGDVVRTLTATSPSIIYSAAHQTADFGTPQSSCTVHVYQLAAGYGRGTPREAVL